MSADPSFVLHYASTDRSVWKSHPARVFVLDSSFNPPTLAHLQYIRTACSGSLVLAAGDPSDPGAIRTPVRCEPFEYAVLLFTANNVDKPHISGASVSDRIDMLKASAAQLSRHFPATIFIVATTASGRFIDKSKSLHQFFSSISAPAESVSPRLFFAMGVDTLVRFVDPKYYPPGSMPVLFREFFKQSTLIYAPRATESVPVAHASGFNTSPVFELARSCGFVETVLEIVNWDPLATTISSTRAREAFQQYHRLASDASESNTSIAEQLQAELTHLRKLVSQEILEYVLAKRLYSS
ncbi:uncharacterized protein BJ171DRAFT_168137 [Polychytrium aggregatum]|uniref:uncharacterized protein n=1 Tax=Polychytrium aggregatum TaxID=110093 RepID=UPI0022FEE83A|nr:uncharacterized protein BJ171DRAFT_168137 [Polychytrium aggregatum]KAI9208788.1 hypothetical protein BJ171DRAFT_168137 [Polychytrium aggregatum]